MIYKFNATKKGAYLELQKENKSVRFSVFDEEDVFILDINKDTLYDLIGALHSLQKKINNQNFDKLSNTF